MFQFDSGLTPMLTAAWLLAAFLCGSVPFGLILVKLAGKGDVRAQGSGNIGATNVSRVAGKGAGVLVLLLDAAKGFLPVLLAKRHGLAPEMVSLIALSAVAGHLFTPWLKFKGGKGVATALGVALGYMPGMVLVPFAAFALLLALFRYVSLGSVVAALLLPLKQWATWYSLRGDEGGAVIVHKIRILELGGHRFLLTSHMALQCALLWSAISLLVIVKHRENIRRLLGNRESKLWGGRKDGAHA